MNIWFDLKYAWRLLTKSWGYSLMCASVVALSVGLAVWTNALTYSQVFKPLGFPGSQSWYSVQIASDQGSRPRPAMDAYTYQQLRAQNRSADFLGAFANRSIVLSEGEATTNLRGVAISPRLLAATSVVPLLGRTFAETDGRAEAEEVAILSHEAWQTYFASDPAIVGRTARLNAKPVQIIGVLPEDFFGFQDYEVWVPLHLPKLAQPNDTTMSVYALIALRDNQQPDSLIHELQAAVSDVNRSYPQLFKGGRSVALVPAGRMFTHGNTPIVAMLSVAAIAVLLLGCVNISMVFLARLLERSRELALRTALGASRPRLLRQCLLETALIVGIGLIAGYGLAAWGVGWTEEIGDAIGRVFADGRSSNMPELRPLDFLLAVIAAVAVWLLSTLIPAWRIAKQDAAIVLAGSGKGTTLRGSNKSVALLVGLQVVISCIVLVTCGNVVLAVKKETTKPTGMVTGDVLLSVHATSFDARYDEPAQRLRYWDELTAAVQNKVPGAQIAYTTAAPSRPLRVPARIETKGDEPLTLPLTIVSENYFDVLGIQLRAGRLFDSTDNAQSLHVAVVDEEMAMRFWPDDNPIGKRVQLTSSDSGMWLTVVGVVSTVPGSPYRVDAELGSLYQPLRQAVPAAFQLLVKGRNVDRNAIRAAAFAVDRDLPVQNLQSLDDVLQAIRLGTAALIPVFSAVSLITALLAASGLFGLISRSVAQRTQEVGIRRALGATVLRATSMFLRQGALYLTVAIVGLGFGIGIMPLLSRAIPNILDHVIPVTTGVVLLMAGVISTASYLPTRRAVALEPGDALRYE
jgi:putative ABC transport system permease protein